MEGNRDEAEKCINIATKAVEAGDREKALKFLNKAEKLYPTDKAKALLEALTWNGSRAGNGTSCQQPADGTDSSRTRPEGEGQDPGPGESAKAFTKDQVEGVQR
ncbi:hypothetical protein AAFF_G00135130 [Aldrovandia affinis]|uniref:DnaJ heat shock protein family (Hsp40) member B14 n=1 Tax=Aldrovandia affinis TaxID=143900 RepID=A0AAD7RQF5_9TELE|nr:hypothetical protein AAFF_G00135130 [Aldrovandia affinis]